MRLPTRKAEKERDMREEDPHVTKEAYTRMEKTLARLQHDRLALAEEVARTAAMGDLSENAAYQYAKQQLRSALSRITHLQLALARAVIIHKPISDGKIRLGSTVTVSQGEKLYTWTILGEKEARPDRGAISHHSPVGNALLGHSVGDKVLVHLGERSVEYEVREVR